MRITPLDIYQQEFKRVLRGVDPDEVEDFLERVADDYEQLIKENTALKKQIESLETQLATGMRPEPVNVSETEIKEKADSIVRDAKREAENIIRQARKEAENIVRKARDEDRKTRPVVEMVSHEGTDGGVGSVSQEARSRPEQLAEEARMEELKLRREISRLRGQRERFLLEYRGLLEKHLRILTAESSEETGE